MLNSDCKQKFCLCVSPHLPEMICFNMVFICNCHNSYTLGIYLTGKCCAYIVYFLGTTATSYTPGIYAEGYIVFVVLFVRTYVRSFVCDSVPFMALLQSFTLKFLKWGISQQPLIRKHSYLDRRYPGGSAFIP